MIVTVAVNEKEFNNSRLPILFHDEGYAHSYYLLLYDENYLLKFSGQSQIEPITRNIGNFIAVGLDQCVGFFSIETKSIVKSILLPSFFYEFYISDGYILIICEVDVLILNIGDLSEYKEFSFSDYITRVDIHNDVATVHFITGEIEEIAI